MKFRRKPVVVEAEKFFPESKPWPQGVREYHDCTPGGCMSWGLYEMDTPEGRVVFEAGAWIITGTEGERYPCEESIFEKTYEPVELDQCHNCCPPGDPCPCEEYPFGENEFCDCGHDEGENNA